MFKILKWHRSSHGYVHASSYVLCPLIKRDSKTLQVYNNNKHNRNNIIMTNSTTQNIRIRVCGARYPRRVRLCFSHDGRAHAGSVAHVSIMYNIYPAGVDSAPGYQYNNNMRV